jgi:starch synthase
VLTVTDLEKAHMRSIVPAWKCSTVGNGIDPEEFGTVPPPGLFRDRYGIDGPYLLYSGRLASNKGLAHLFSALPSIFRSFDGTMVLVGKDWGMKDGLQRMARESKLHGRVKFIDFLSDREMYKSALAGSELFVLPSQWEAFGIVLLEAAMCGKASVATAVGGVPEVIESGKTGVLVPYGDPAALSEAVGSLLKEPERAKAMGQSARKTALETHTWPKVVDRVLKAYGS